MNETVLTNLDPNPGTASRLVEAAMAAPPPGVQAVTRREWSPWFEALDILMDKHGYELLPACEWIVAHDATLEDDRSEQLAKPENAGKTWAQCRGIFQNFYQAMARHRRALARRRRG